MTGFAIKSQQTSNCLLVLLPICLVFPTSLSIIDNTKSVDSNNPFGDAKRAEKWRDYLIVSRILEIVADRNVPVISEFLHCPSEHRPRFFHLKRVFAGEEPPKIFNWYTLEPEGLDRKETLVILISNIQTTQKYQLESLYYIESEARVKNLTSVTTPKGDFIFFSSRGGHLIFHIFPLDYQQVISKAIPLVLKEDRTTYIFDFKILQDYFF